MGESSQHMPVFIGPYELRGRLGEGAMAVVWRAYDHNLDREVAIKEPKFGAGDSEERIEELGRRFVKEGRAAARLNHPNIVTIYAADIYDGRPAIVMELVEGITLNDLLKSGPVESQLALQVAQQLLDAVEFAHDKGIVHRDIKPENVFINEAGVVKLADFGIAHIEDGHATRATMMGTVLGSPGYMSPEQAVGDAVDGRSDIFSIGVVLYEMLAGSNPFTRGESSDATTVLYRTVHEPVPELSESARAGLPADLRPAVMAALAKDPNDRPQTAAQFKAMLGGDMSAPDHTTRVAVAAGAASRGSANNTLLSKYLPYLLVGVIGVAIIAVLIVRGNQSTTGGVVTPPVGEAGTEAELGGAFLRFNSDDKLVVYKGQVDGDEEESRVTGLRRSEIEAFDEGTAKRLVDGIAYDSLEEAENAVEGYIKSINELGITAAKDSDDDEGDDAASSSAPAPASDDVEISVVGKDGSTRTAIIHRQGSTERVFANSNTEYLSAAEVAALSDAERCVAWNEIIASFNGYSFKNSGLSNYFNNYCRSWYRPLGGSSDIGGFPDAARKNIELLQSYTDGWWKVLAAY